MNPELRKIATKVVQLARKHGARAAAVSIEKTRFTDLRQRNGTLDAIREASSSSLELAVYAHDKYSSHSTSDLRPQAIERFAARAVDMTKHLAVDRHRHLADPALYAGRSMANLEIYDPNYESLDTAQRQHWAAAAEAAARAVSGPITAVEASYNDRAAEWVRVHSNGFEDGERATGFALGATATVADGERRPSAGEFVRARHLSDLATPETVGKHAAERAIRRVGQVTLDSGAMTMVLENRVAGRILSYVTAALSGEMVHQQRSFLLAKQGAKVGSELFTLVDDPLMKRGFGSERFDSDGISRQRRVLIDRGVLRTYLIDVYYGAKLGVTPTSNSLANLILPPGPQSPQSLIAGIDRGIYVTGIIGGNADFNTGDFSHGILGFEIAGGQLGRPIGQMNITGSHRDLWSRLVAVGNDPYPHSRWRLPTMVFDKVSVSGV